MTTGRREEGHVTEAEGSRAEGSRAGERRCLADGLEDGRDHESRNATTEDGKGKEMNSPLRSPEEA